MPFKAVHPAALAAIASAIVFGPSLDARQPAVPSVQYRSPEGVEYRSLPDTDAVTTERAALDSTIYGIWYHLGIVQ